MSDRLASAGRGTPQGCSSQFLFGYPCRSHFGISLGPFEHLIGLFPLPVGPIINLELADGLEAFVDVPRLADLKSHTSESDVWCLLEEWTRKLRELTIQWPILCWDTSKYSTTYPSSFSVYQPEHLSETGLDLARILPRPSS